MCKDMILTPFTAAIIFFMYIQNHSVHVINLLWFISLQLSERELKIELIVACQQTTLSQALANMLQCVIQTLQTALRQICKRYDAIMTEEEKQANNVLRLFTFSLLSGLLLSNTERVNPTETNHEQNNLIRGRKSWNYFNYRSQWQEALCSNTV